MEQLVMFSALFLHFLVINYFLWLWTVSLYFGKTQLILVFLKVLFLVLLFFSYTLMIFLIMLMLSSSSVIFRNYIKKAIFLSRVCLVGFLYNSSCIILRSVMIIILQIVGESDLLCSSSLYRKPLGVIAPAKMRCLVPELFRVKTS